MAESFLYMIYSAMANDQSSLSQMQIIDGDSALLFTQIEEQIYSAQNGKGGAMYHANSEIAKYAGWMQGGNTAQRQEWGAEISKWQSAFSSAQSTAQSNESQADTLVQNAQTQTGQDSSNLQQKTQLAQSINMIGSFLANILAQHY
jgi:ATP/maltotriose-dependent transcriptional regulator MalT